MTITQVLFEALHLYALLHQRCDTHNDLQVHVYPKTSNTSHNNTTSQAVQNSVERNKMKEHKPHSKSALHRR